MGRILLTVAAVAGITAAAILAHAGAAGDTGRLGFRTPDAGAACRVEAARLVCASLGSSDAVALRAKGSPSLVNRLPWWDASTPVLTRWHRGRITCTLRGTAIRCRNGDAAFAVDRAGFFVRL